VLAVAAQLLWGGSCEMSCPHEAQGVDAPSDASENYTVLEEGRSVLHDLTLNSSRLYYYQNFNVTTMNQPDRYRKLILSLEPCEGIVYLLVRKTRRCWPDPQSCCNPLPGSVFQGATLNSSTAPPCNPALHSISCAWTHFHSVLDGSRDAAPTFFEVPLSSTKYYIRVFAPREANMNHGVMRVRYRLTALADIGAYPRPGLQGRIRATQVSDRSVELSWEEATFVPVGISGLRNYHIYSSLLLDRDTPGNDAVFLSPSKVMNSACGLERNAVKYGMPLTSANCHNGLCAATISGIVPKRRYMLNIIAESHRRFNSSYSGIIVSSDWTETSQVLTDSTIALIGSICGTVFGVAVIGYLWIVKLYK